MENRQPEDIHVLTQIGTLHTRLYCFRYWLIYIHGTTGLHFILLFIWGEVLAQKCSEKRKDANQMDNVVRKFRENRQE